MAGDSFGGGLVRAFAGIWTSVGVAGVELDDKSHQHSARQKRDEFVDEVFRSCGLPLLHVPAQANYSVAELKASLAQLLQAPAEAATRTEG